MHTYNDTRTRDNTLALYGAKYRSPAYRAVQAVARACVLFASLALVTILPHAIAYALVPA